MAEEERELRVDMHSDPETMAGHYANFVNVSHSDYEFTLTFARVDHESADEDQVTGVIVSRINLSHRCMAELMDAMEDNFSKWEAAQKIRELPEYRAADESQRSGGGPRPPDGQPGSS